MPTPTAHLKNSTSQMTSAVWKVVYDTGVHIKVRKSTTSNRNCTCKITATGSKIALTKSDFNKC